VEEAPQAPVETTATEPVNYPQLSAVSAEKQTVRLGALYPEVKRTDDPEKYKFMVFLNSKGASVENVIMSEFESRGKATPSEVLSADSSTDAKVIHPLSLLSPFGKDGHIYSLANTSLKVAPANASQFDTKAFPLDKLNWKHIETEKSDEARFEAILKDADTGGEVLKLIKTYSIQPGSYDLQCDIAVENLSGAPIKVLMQMQGPGGMTKEDVRQDARKVKVAYLAPEQTQVEVVELEAPAMAKKLKKHDTEAFALKTKNADAAMAWSAVTNKYFAAIIRPVPEEGQTQRWMSFNQAQYYAPPGDDKDDQNCSFSLSTRPIMLTAAGQDGARQSYSLQVYVGPKDKKIFEKNDIYRKLGYFHTIDFRGCCCPQNVIAPLAFSIIWLMNAMYTLMGPLGNYGVVIMILVFLVRLLLHPITKKSQISMMKMQKLGPKMKEIQAKYANNKAEMNKQVMAMYREQGVSPVSGMLPMFLQMPIWIALWTAVNTSIDIRGAGFLPFWITDLASPDHLFAIPFAAKIQTLPYIGAVFPSYFNLLPILMGVVMYLQQKMMPSSQAAAQTNPQMAQQQKMMMIMMPLLFPIMLYSGPSGVNLYIMSSITAGVIEQKVIRKHLKEKEELEAIGKVPVTTKTGGKVKKKKPKPMFKG
jgi:YidC/Oxa1 family membrane protein insertase